MLALEKSTEQIGILDNQHFNKLDILVRDFMIQLVSVKTQEIEIFKATNDKLVPEFQCGEGPLRNAINLSYIIVDQVYH